MMRQQEVGAELLAPTFPTSAYTFISKVLAFLVVLSIVSWATYFGPMLRIVAPRRILPPLGHQETRCCGFRAFGFREPRTWWLVLFRHISPLRLSRIFFPSSAGPGLLAPFPPAGDLPSWSSYTNLVNLPTLRPPFVQSFLASCNFKLFKRLVLNQLCFYLKFKNLISSRPAFLGRLLTYGRLQLAKLSCPNLTGTASKRKDFQTELFWPP